MTARRQGLKMEVLRSPKMWVKFMQRQQTLWSFGEAATTGIEEKPNPIMNIISLPFALLLLCSQSASGTVQYVAWLWAVFAQRHFCEYA